MRFEQQVALVTGAASGIGRALVQRFIDRTHSPVAQLAEHAITVLQVCV